MTYPANASDLRELAATMREVGALQAFGVVLGPPPSRLEALTAKVEAAGEPTPELAEEIEAAKRQERRAEMRETLAHTGRVYSDDELDRMLGQ